MLIIDEVWRESRDRVENSHSLDEWGSMEEKANVWDECNLKDEVEVVKVIIINTKYLHYLN